MEGRKGEGMSQGVGLATIRRAVIVASWVSIVLLVSVAGYSYAQWQKELAEIDAIFAPRVVEGMSDADIILATRAYFRDEVGYERMDDYFLTPALSFMRPTALQIIRAGGDCSYRTRAFVVTLRRFGIAASKVALHDDNGVPVHSVAGIETGDGPLYVDMLFNVEHRAEDGTHLTLDDLADPEVLAESLDRAVASGNNRAAEYPTDLYDFEDVRTINWDKNGPLRMAYRALVAIAGEERARTVPRPYLSEEPALMVLTLCFGGISGLALLLALLWASDPARRTRVQSVSPSV